MRANSLIPRNFGVPLLVAQGSADLIISPTVTRTFVTAVCRAGQPVRFLQLAGGDHVTIAKRTASTTMDWIADRFAGRAQQDDCGSL